NFGGNFSSTVLQSLETNRIPIKGDILPTQDIAGLDPDVTVNSRGNRKGHAMGRQVSDDIDIMLTLNLQLLSRGNQTVILLEYCIRSFSVGYAIMAFKITSIFDGLAQLESSFVFEVDWTRCFKRTIG